MRPCMPITRLRELGLVAEPSRATSFMKARIRAVAKRSKRVREAMQGPDLRAARPVQKARARREDAPRSSTKRKAGHLPAEGPLAAARARILVGREGHTNYDCMLLDGL